MKRALLATALLAALASGSAFAQCDPITGHCGGPTEEPGFRPSSSGPEVVGGETPAPVVEAPVAPVVETPVAAETPAATTGPEQTGSYLNPHHYIRELISYLRSADRANRQVFIAGVRARVLDLRKSIRTFIAAHAK